MSMRTRSDKPSPESLSRKLAEALRSRAAQAWLPTVRQYDGIKRSLRPALEPPPHRPWL